MMQDNRSFILRHRACTAGSMNFDSYLIYLMDPKRYACEIGLGFTNPSIEEAIRSASEMKRKGWDGSLSSAILLAGH